MNHAGAVCHRRTGTIGLWMIVGFWLVGIMGAAAQVVQGAERFAVDPRADFSDRYPVEIPVLGAEQAKLVVEQGVDVDGVTLPEGPSMPGTVRAYVNDAERDLLTALGFSVRQIRNESKEMGLLVDQEWRAREAEPGYPKPLDPGTRGWPTYPELEAELQAVAAAHPDICQLISIGTSVQGRAIWFLKISDNASIEEAEPEFKFTSSLHGDEVTGMELCRRMIHYLVDNYNIDPAVTNLVNSAELWFNPMSNPDGFVNHTRYNAQGYDLNREFPDPITDPVDNPAGRPTEVQLFMNFGYPHNFILSANYHGGALVMNIPWDCQYPHIPDYTMTWNIAEGYSYRNPPMWNGNGGIGQHGVVVGADWYIIHGGMQDWCYNWRNEIDITIEVSQTKWPNYTLMDQFWTENRDSMLWYMNRVINGGIVKGVVTSAGTGLPLSVSVNVTQINKAIMSDPDVGDYHRMLMPGTYTFTFTKSGYDTQTIPNVVVNATTPTTLDVAMVPTMSSAPLAGNGVTGTPLSLSAAWPNPTAVSSASSGAIQVDLTLAAGGSVSAAIYDIGGREVRTLSSGPFGAGTHTLVWDGRDFHGAPAAAGIYWVRVSSGREAAQRPVVLIR